VDADIGCDKKEENDSTTIEAWSGPSTSSSTSRADDIVLLVIIADADAAVVTVPVKSICSLETAVVHFSCVNSVR
jgi:hypothetical protein